MFVWSEYANTAWWINRVWLHLSTKIMSFFVTFVTGEKCYQKCYQRMLNEHQQPVDSLPVCLVGSTGQFFCCLSSGCGAVVLGLDWAGRSAWLMKRTVTAVVMESRLPSAETLGCLDISSDNIRISSSACGFIFWASSWDSIYILSSVSFCCILLVQMSQNQPTLS